MSPRPVPRTSLRSLLWWLLGGTLLAMVTVGAAAMFGLYLSVPLMVSLALAGAAVLWIVNTGAARDDVLDPPALDRDADYALPHAQDARVRRLEEMIHGAQPRRRMTGRALARQLGEVADERARDPEAPQLSPELARLIARSRESAEADDHPVGPIDRRTLHRHLRELADENNDSVMTSRSVPQRYQT